MKKLILVTFTMISLGLYAQKPEKDSIKLETQQLLDWMAKLEQKLQNIDNKISALEQKVTHMEDLFVANSKEDMPNDGRAALLRSNVYKVDENPESPLRAFADSPIKLGSDWKYQIFMSPFSLSITNGQVVNLSKDRSRKLRVDIYVGPKHFVAESNPSGHFLVKRELGAIEPLTSFGNISLNSFLHELPSGTYYIDIILLQQREDGKWQVMDVHPLSKKLTI